MKEKLTLSRQAVESILLACQKAFLMKALGKSGAETDLGLMLSEFELVNSPTGLEVLNPPVVEFLNDDLNKLEE